MGSTVYVACAAAWFEDVGSSSEVASIDSCVPLAPPSLDLLIGFANVKSLGKEPASSADGAASGWLCGRPFILRKKFGAKGYHLVGIAESRVRDAVSFFHETVILLLPHPLTHRVTMACSFGFPSPADCDGQGAIASLATSGRFSFGCSSNMLACGH